jgi:histidinol-phosphatase (PHP family)
MWSNYHTHSKYCDGKNELIDYVSMARQKNIKSLGFSSHAPVPFDCKWCMPKDKLAAYLEQIDTLKISHQDIELYKSLEIDFIPGVISPFEFKDELDYTIGSIHFIDKLPDNTPWEIDGTHAVFKEGYEKIFNSNIRDVLVRYFELTREMIYASDPTIIGHLDKIKIQNIDGKYFNETDQWYKDEVLKTLKLIEQAESIVEVNTRGIYQKKTTTTYPSPWILEIIRDKNIPITISSDAHHPDDLTNQFEQTSELLLKMKFKKLSILSEGKWKQLPFDNHGIIF